MYMLVLWVVEPRGLVDKYRSSREIRPPSPEDADYVFLRNVGTIYLEIHTALQPIRRTSTSSPP
jgi:hypothetical protein